MYVYHTISNPQTQLRIGYRNSANSNKIKFDSAATGYAKLSGSTPLFDNNGTLTNLSPAMFTCIWIFATNRFTTPIVAILGQRQDSTIALAQSQSLPTLTGFSVAEWKLLYRVIVKNQSGSLAWQQSDPMYSLTTGPAINASAPSIISASIVSTSGSYSNAQDYLIGLEIDKLNKTGGEIKGYIETSATATNTGSAYTIPAILNGNNVRELTLNSASVTFTLPAVSTSGKTLSFMLLLNNTSASAIAWNGGGISPTWITPVSYTPPATGKKQLVSFTSINGSPWYGIISNSADI